MRLSELNLVKYGKFDGCDLRFGSRAPDLQIIFGPNEAGKSTTMSAITDLLFGFPHIAAFDFRHDKRLLRVGAVIEADGEFIACRRKRGNAGTLLDSEERVLDEGWLTARLAGYTDVTFKRMFSLDHTRLRQGGEAILQAQDDIGQAIFAAGSGLVGVAGLLENLEVETKAIWTRRTSNASYHVAQKAFDNAKARLKTAQMKPGAWDEMRRDLVRLDEKLAELRKNRTGLELEREKIERYRRVLPPAAFYKQAILELEQLGDVVLLPTDAAKIHQQALAALATAKVQEELALAQATSLRTALDGLTVHTTLLDRSDAIDELREAKGAVDPALAQLPRRHIELATRNTDLAELQREIGWPKETARSAKDRLPQRVLLADARSLLEERAGLDRLLTSAQDEYVDRKADLDNFERQRAALPPARDITALSDSLRYARGRSDLDAVVASARREADQKSEELETNAARLNPSVGDVATLRALAVPGEREIAGATTQLSLAEDRHVEAGRDFRLARNRLDDVKLQREHLLRDENAVSLEAVMGARSERDATWEQLRAGIVEGAQLPEAKAAADRFEHQSTAADDISDKRFLVAEQSGRLAAIEEEIERVALTISQHEEQVAEAQVEVERVTTSWRATLVPCGMDLTPKAFASWAECRDRVLDAATAAAQAIAASEAATSLRSEIASVLLTALEVAGASPPAWAGTFALLLQTAENLYETECAATRRRDELQAQITTATAAVVRAETKRDGVVRDIADWQGRWTPAVTGTGLDPAVSFAVVRARLDLLENARGEIEAILDLEHRVMTMQNDIDDFDRQVRALASECGVLGVSGAAADLLIGLARAADEAKTLAERRAGLNQQLLDVAVQLQGAKDAGELAKAAVRPLMEASLTEDNSALGIAIGRSDRARGFHAELKRLGENIVSAGGGPLLEALLEEVRGADGDTLKVQSGELQDAIRSLSEEIEAKAAERATVQAEFARFDDGPDAAMAAADMELARSEMAAHAETYVRKRAEVSLLRWAIDRYRAEKQTPLLKRASALFSTLTRGNYVSLLVDAEGNKARLSGLARNESVVPVEGMSEGTVDQLFLALRLAAVEDAVASGAKLPFLADDLFINYDDDRAMAGFEVLAELAKSTQVLFLTHHHHLLSIAENAMGAGNVAICELA